MSQSIPLILARVARQVLAKFGSPCTLSRNTGGTFDAPSDRYTADPIVETIVGNAFAATEDRKKLDPQGDFDDCDVLLLMEDVPSWSWKPDAIGVRAQWAGREWRVGETGSYNPDGQTHALWLLGLAQ